MSEEEKTYTFKLTWQQFYWVTLAVGIQAALSSGNKSEAERWDALQEELLSQWESQAKHEEKS